MILFSKPSARDLGDFVASLENSPLSYAEVGCTLRGSPPGYATDQERVQLGKGRDCFAAACAALRRWTMFQLGWVEAIDPRCPIQTGRDVGVLCRLPPAWIVCGCRIVEVIDVPGKRLGFAYGTLEDHVERGEERFLIERDEADAVWYEILAISRPARWYVHLGRPIARSLQRRFRRDSLRAMQEAVAVAG